jgi:hypothetical protein
MPNDYESVFLAEQERVSHLETNQLPLLGAATQTRLSWARVVATFDELPDFYRASVTALLSGSRPFPYAVLTPTYAGYSHREKQKLIFSLDEAIHILERDKNRLNHTRYALADIHYVEVGAILLDAWIRLSGLTSEGTLTSTRLRFNTVTDRLFIPFLQQIRAAVNDGSQAELKSEYRKFDYLMPVNFKFMNYACNSLRPGDRVIASVLQPEIRKPIVTLFGRSLSRMVTTSHLSILTDSEWISICDDERAPAWHDGIRHGGVWTYVPLNKIAAASLAMRRDGLLAVTIHLPHGDSLESVFAADHRHEVDQLLTDLSEWAPHVTVKRDWG